MLNCISNSKMTSIHSDQVYREFEFLTIQVISFKQLLAIDNLGILSCHTKHHILEKCKNVGGFIF